MTAKSHHLARSGETCGRSECGVGRPAHNLNPLRRAQRSRPTNDNGALGNLPQRRGSDTAPYQTTDIQLHRYGSAGLRLFRGYRGTLSFLLGFILLQELPELFDQFLPLGIGAHQDCIFGGFQLGHCGL